MFPQAKNEGLTAIGREVVDAMVDEGILIDLTHMRAESIRDVLNQLDARDPAKEIPLIATHMAYRFGGLEILVRRRHDQGGGGARRRARCILCKHSITSGLPGVNASARARSRRCASTSTRSASSPGATTTSRSAPDLDGYIKPALPGLEDMSRMTELQAHLHARYGAADAEKICNGNALRVLRAEWGHKRPRTGGRAAGT